MYSITPEVTKEFIQKRVSDEELWKTYFPHVDFQKPFRSPLRDDKRDTCSFYFDERRRLIMKDFNGSFCGDIFEALLLYFGFDYFPKVLDKIAKDFKLIDGNSGVVVPVKFEVKEVNYEKIPVKIEILSQPFTKVDKEYWGSYYISEKTLNRYQVTSASKVWWTDKSTGEHKIRAVYNNNNPIYSYYFNKSRYKIYFPFQELYRFRGNTDHLQGYNELPAKGDLLIITKSQKDVMCLHELGYVAVAPHGEGHYSKLTTTIEELKKRFSKIYLNFDNDSCGITNLVKRAEEYCLPYFIVPIESKVKDVSDYVKQNGVYRTKELLNKLIV